MKQKLTLLILALFCTVGTWAGVLPTAVAGSCCFDSSNPFLTHKTSSDATITTAGDGAIIIHASDLCTVSGSRSYAAVAMVVDMPAAPGSFANFFRLKTATNDTGAIGLGVTTEGKLKGTWQAGTYGPETTSAVTGEHTIIMLCNNSGTTIYVDDASTSVNNGGLRCATQWTDLRIESAYKAYVKKVFVFKGEQSGNISSIFSELAAIVTVGNEETKKVSDNSSATHFYIATGGTLTLDKDGASISLCGSGTALQSTNITTTVTGNLPALTLKATDGTLTYTGTNLDGTTLDGVILGGTTRITTSNIVTIKNLAGNNLSGTSYNYAFVGSGTLNFEGTCDLTKKSDGTDCDSPKLGYGKSDNINIKSGANVTTAAILNTTTGDNNACITVESGATLSATGDIQSFSVTNNGTIIGTILYGPITLGNGSVTTLSNATPFNDNYDAGTGAVTVNGDATLNLTATTATLNKAITVAASKTLTIDGGSNTVNLNVVPTFGASSKINFKDATINYPSGIRNLANYTFTSSTARFIETTDEYKAGGFTITNIPSGVTIKVKKYGASDYDTVTPTDGTATISHEVGVSGLAAWLDYTFNESTKATNIHSPADQIITNAGNAGSGNNLTIDWSYDTANSYNEDGTLKVMSTPWRDITWPTNYTVAVAGNVPDVENGCLVAFGSSTKGSKNYLAIIRGASQNEIKLVKGHEMNNAFEVISTMTAANATALSHLVVFTKNGNTFTVYLDGVQKTQVTYSETLGGGFQIGSLHGGVTGTGVGRVNDMEDAIKEKIFAKAIRVYDYVISAGQMTQLTEEFPYVSYGGTYSRTISEDSNLSATNAWLNKGTQGNVDVPVNAVVDEVTYYPDVEITTTAASTLTVNADMDAENIKFDGSGKLTIASDGSHNINIYGSVTADGPVSVNYDQIDLTAVPVTIGESGSIEFDFSDHDFSSVLTSTDYPVTGNTSDYGVKVTGVYPDDEDHSYTLAFNGTSNRYILTVAPTILLKGKLAIALVKPYYDDNYVGAGLGKYTISLGVTSYATLSDFETAVEAWESLEDYVEPTIAINQPTSAFYRIKSGSKYLQDVRKADNATQRILTDDSGADESAETIFYLDNNRLIGYKTGFGFQYSVCQTRDTGKINTQLFTASSEKGKYTIQSQQGTCTSALDNEGYWGINDSDLSREADAANGACWTIEQVESLPVTISSAGYATLYSPVALTIPTGVKAYYISDLTTTEATLTEITTTIPAETPVVLKAGADTYNFTITTADAFSGTNYLEGQIAAFSVSEDDVTNKVYYTLQRNAADTQTGFYPKTAAGSIAGFKAYLPSSAFGGGGVKGFTFIFEDDADAIVSPFEKTEEGAIYNLAGQRISKMQKGINIVNGKKILK